MPISVAVAAALVVDVAFGQDAGSAERAEPLIEEIIVTATRRSTSLQDVPFNISAMSGETIDRLRVWQLSELARHVPGLVVIDQGNRAASRMTVRGLNVASLTEEVVLFNTSGGTVATYIGDIPMYVDLRMRDLDRVEVLLGPQGTLYGAGSLGGAVRYIPRPPSTEDWEATVSVSGFGSEESDNTGSDIWAVLNAPVVDGRLGLRAYVSRYDDPGFTDYLYVLKEPGLSNPQPDFDDPADVDANLIRVDDADSGEITAARAALLWEISDAASATLSYYYQETDYGSRSINHRHALGTGRYESGHRILEPNERKNQLVSLEILADLGFAELVSATGISDYEELGQRDGTDLVLLLENDLWVAFADFVTISRDDTKEDRFNQEIRLVSQNDGPWSWIAGLFYNKYEFRTDYTELHPGHPEFLGISRPDNLGIIIVLEEELEESALFGELAYRITDEWDVTVGARFFETDSKSGNATDFPILNTFLGFYGPDETNVNVQSFDFDDDGVLFKLNSSYRFSQNAMGYVTISEGFRPGGINPFPACEPDGSIPFCLRPDEVIYESDTTLNYEVGLRSNWLGGNVVLNAALYHIDWEAAQLEAVSLDGFFITKNGGDAESQGLELDLRARFSNHWRASLNYAYNTAELTSFAPRLIDSFVDGLPGDRLAGVPEHQVGANLNFSRTLPRGWQLNLDYGFTYSSEIYTKVGLRNNGEVLPSYTFHNIAGTFHSPGDWTFRLFVDNLFDEYAETNVRGDPSFVRDVGVHPLRWNYRNVARPRRYGVEVRYDFDFD